MDSSAMDNLFFYASKFIWSFASPDHLLLLLLSVAVLRLWWRTRRPPTRDKPVPLKLLTFCLLGFWLVALYPLGNWLLYPLENRYPRADLTQLEAGASGSAAAQPISGVIVLGGAERLHASQYWQSLEVNAVSERLLALLEVVHRYPQLPVIYSSGSGLATEQGIRGADLVENYMQQLGLDDQVVFERQSRNTYENALYSKPIMAKLSAAHPGADGKPWLLVTSAFHMPRAVAIFQQLEIPVLPYSVDHWSLPPASQGLYFNLSGNLSDLKMGVREWLGLLAYRFSGKTDTLLGQPVH